MTNKASDKELGALHKALADSMLKSLTASDEAAFLLEQHREDLPDAVVAFLDTLANVSPALFTAAAKFLKDNNITCAKEDSPEMTALEERLQSKRKRVGNVIPIEGE